MAIHVEHRIEHEAHIVEQLLVLMLRSEHESPEKRFIKTHSEYASSIAEKNYFIENVNAYIKEHLSERLSVEDIASHFGYSRSRLSTLYKQHTGMGLNKAVNMEKHLKARQLLIESDYSVSEISEMLGFSSPQYFTNTFEKSTGIYESFGTTTLLSSFFCSTFSPFLVLIAVDKRSI